MDAYNHRRLVIDPSLYQHPMDKAITGQIREHGGFRKVLRFIGENSTERFLRGYYLSSQAKLTPRNAPKLYAMIDAARAMFSVEGQPDFFLERRYDMRAVMLGVEKPMVLLSTDFMMQADDAMLWGLVAGLIGSMRTGYCEIRTIDWLIHFTRGLLPEALTRPLGLLLAQWRKYSQLSSDRSALLATGDFNAVMRMILCGEVPISVLQGVDFSDPRCGYMQQCQEYLADENFLVDTIRNVNANFGRTVMYATRYLELFQFYQGSYHDLMEEFAR